MRYFITGIIFVLLMSPACSKKESQLERFLHNVQKESSSVQKKQVVEEFIHSHTWPYVQGNEVCFMFRDSLHDSVALAGDMNGWKPDSIRMCKIKGTDYFYVIQNFPADARLEYKFVRGKEYVPDPLNPVTSTGGFGINSVLRMPEYVFPKWILANRNSEITVPDTIQFKSRLLKNSRMVFIYSHAAASKNSPLILFNDGGDYLTYGSASIVLDNLVAAGRIPPVHAVFINPVNRMREYWLNDAYLNMVFMELLPQIKQRYGWMPESTGLGGVSLGGVTALYALKKHSSQLDFVFSQSGALWIEKEKIIHSIQQLTPVTQTFPRVWFDFGSFEGVETVHQKLELLLRQKQIPYGKQIYPEGHNWANWRAHLDRVLQFCLQKEKQQ
jgi:enterochelin esterase family protein